MKGYLKFGDHPKVQAITEKLGEYNKQLKLYGLQDYQVLSQISELSPSALRS